MNDAKSQPPPEQAPVYAKAFPQNDLCAYYRSVHSKTHPYAPPFRQLACNQDPIRSAMKYVRLAYSR
jgi:hypothetical protein